MACRRTTPRRSSLPTRRQGSHAPLQAPIRILHLDLKSLNVLVCADEYGDVLLKICDFGSSRQVGLQMARRRPARYLQPTYVPLPPLYQMLRDTKSATAAGTIAWMAPEYIRREHITEAADV